MPAPKGVEFGSFGGLDLRDDPQEVSAGAAIDMLNIDMDRPGRIRTRDGYAKFTTAASADRIDGLFGYGFTVLGYSSSTNKVRLYDSTGALIATSAALNTTFFGSSFVYYKSSPTEYIYGNQGNAVNTILRTDFTTFTYPAVGYSARFVATQPRDNRLVLCDTGEAGAVGVRIRFSGAGTPETFAANDYVDLLTWPVTGVATFGDQLFVFGFDKFFVFYGNDVSGSGTPIFNYRTVDTGIGISDDRPGACCVSPNGIYFLGRDGVYKTTGGPPVKVSSALDPLFNDTLSPYYQGSRIRNFSEQGVGLEWLNGRLYMAVPATQLYCDNMFVLDEKTGQWTVWSLPMSGIATVKYNEGSNGSRSRIVFGYGTGTNDIGVLTPTVTTDAGAAIASRYRTGFVNFGQPGAESWVREVLLDGTGTVTLKSAVNDAVTLGTGAAVTLGTAPAVTQGRDRRGARARNFSYEFSGSGPWSLSRAEPIVWGQRSTGMKAA